MGFVVLESRAWWMRLFESSGPVDVKNLGAPRVNTEPKELVITVPCELFTLSNHARSLLAEGLAPLSTA